MNKRILIFSIILSAFTVTYNCSLFGAQAHQAPLLNIQNASDTLPTVQPCCCPDREPKEIADGCCTRSVCLPNDSDICCRLGSNRYSVCCTKTVCYMMCIGAILGGIVVAASISSTPLTTTMHKNRSHSLIPIPLKHSIPSMIREDLPTVDLQAHLKRDSFKLKLRRKK